MPQTTKLLDKAREVCSLESDAALARRFGFTPAQVSNYRQGIRHADVETIDTLCKAIGEPPTRWALMIQADREKGAKAKRIWLQMAGLAACLALAGPVFVSHSPGSVYYVNLLAVGIILALLCATHTERQPHEMEL